MASFIWKVQSEENGTGMETTVIAEDVHEAIRKAEGVFQIKRLRNRVIYLVARREEVDA